MADTLTANYSFVKPEITGSPSTWGNKLNADLDSIDNLIKTNSNAIVANAAAAMPIAGGTFTGAPRSSVADGGTNQLVTHDQVVSLINVYLPAGIIAIWAGSIASIPAKWIVCDGTGGITPDLRNRFIMGAGAGAQAPGAVGGASTATPTITVDAHVLTTTEMPAHSHGVNDPGHAHGVSDPGHRHWMNTTGAAYASSAFLQAPTTKNDPGTAIYATSPEVTGVSIQGAFTGISIQNAGSGGGHAHTASSSAISILPPWYALCYIMRVGT